MQLHQLGLQDFQAHKAKLIKFSPGITSIVGATDAGKSSILRALRWLCLNDLSGDAFIRYGKSFVCAVLKVDKHQIIRAKTKGTRNTYELDEKIFSAVARDVPQAISQVLQVSPINFQNQHDSPFWFSESAPEVSRQLNAVVDLAVIDTTLSNIASAVREAQQTQNICEQRLEELKQEQEELSKQKKRVEQFNQLKQAYETYQAIEKACGALEQAISDIQSGQNLARKKLPPDFSPVEEAYEDWTHKQESVLELEEILVQLSRASSNLSKTKFNLEVAEERFEKETKGKICPLCQNQLP